MTLTTEAGIFAVLVIAGSASLVAKDVGSSGATSEGKQVFDKWCADCHAATSPHRQMLAGTYALEQFLIRVVNPRRLSKGPI